MNFKKMAVCYFGNHDPEYARNRVIMRGLRQSGVEVKECNVRGRGLSIYGSLRRKLREVGNFDVLIVGYSDSRWLVPFAQLLTRKPVVWDAFYSVYDSYVFDRKLVSRWHPKAWFYWFSDFLAAHFADTILLDTNQHIEYFASTFYVEKRRFIRVLVGTDEGVFSPKDGVKQEGFSVHFHGKFIPLQGVPTIIRAAKIVEDDSSIRFTIIGGGQTSEVVMNLARKLHINNIHFIDRIIPLQEIARHIQDSDICLGIFGDTPKTQRVIPNKVYEELAMKKPVITADTPAARELLTDRENVLLCRAADPHDLAAKIRELKGDSDLRQHIAEGGYNLFREQVLPRVIGKELLEKLEVLL